VGKRLMRPKLERTEAIRGWSTLFGVPPVARSGVKPASAGARSKSLDDVVARSVSLGYRVVDDYIRQGKKAAERVNSRTYGAETMASDAQDLAVRMLQHASDFAAVWLDFVQLASAGNAWPGFPPAPSAAAASAPAPNAPAGDTSDNDHRGVRIEVVAAQPVEVSLELRPDAGGRPLAVHALRAVDPKKPRITDVLLEPASKTKPAKLRIRVPTKQPAGVYRGLIVEEQTSRPVGSVTVRIEAR